MDSKLEERVRRLLERVVRRPLGELHLDEDLFRAGVLDSFGMIEFLSEIETDFNVQVPEDQLTPESFRSLRSIGATVLRLGGSRSWSLE